MSKGQPHHSVLSKLADMAEPSSATQMVISPWGSVQVFCTVGGVSAGTSRRENTPPWTPRPLTWRAQSSGGGAAIVQRRRVDAVV